MSIRTTVLSALETQQEELCTALEELAPDIDFLSRATNEITTFEVTLRSLWGNEGEQDHTAVLTGNLKTCIETAEIEFMQKNKRPDVQAEYAVCAVLPSGRRVPLPSETWEQYKRKFH